MSWDDVETPEGWAQSSLGEAAQLVKDKVDPSTVPDARYIGLEHVEAHSMRLLGSGRGSDVRSAKARFSAGDVLYGRLRPYLNKVARPDFDGISSTDFLVFTESDRLDAAYLAHYLNQLWVADRAHHLSAGVELPRVDWKSLSKLPITYPPSKSEQRAIARQIEAAKVSRTSAVSRLVAARRAIERFRQAVLIAACSGRLTADWRNVNLSRHMTHLLEERKAAGERKTRRGVVPGAALRPILTKLDIPATWARVTVSRALLLGALTDVKDGNHGANHPKVKDFTPEGVPFIAANLVHDGRIDYDNAPRLSGKPLERLRIGFAKPNDVILTHKGSVGRVAIADRKCILTPQTTYYRCDSELVIPDYLAIYLESLYFYLQLAEEMSQTTRDFVPISDQYLLGLILPPPEEQQEIARRVKEILAFCRAVDGRIAAASLWADRSSRAVAAKAFRGELVLARP